MPASRSKPRIGLITEPMYGPRTGMGRVVEDLFEGLNRWYSDQFEFIELRRGAASWKPPWRRSIYSWYPSVPLAARQADLDLVHNPGQVPTFFRFPVPLVHTVHDLIPLRWPRYSRRGLPLIYRTMNRRTLRLAQRVVAVSYTTASDLHAHYGDLVQDKVSVIHPSVSHRFEVAGDSVFDARVRADHGLERPFLLFVGTREHRKGLPELLRAHQQLRQRGVEVDLVLVGAPGRDGDSAQAALGQIDEAHSVYLPGYLDDAELAALYREATAVVYPSHCEGFGLPPLEAMASGTPVVAAASTAVTEVAGDAACLVSVDNVTELADALYRVIGDQDFRASLVQRGLRRVRNFTWRESVDRYVAIYCELLTKG